MELGKFVDYLTTEELLNSIPVVKEQLPKVKKGLDVVVKSIETLAKLFHIDLPEEVSTLGVYDGGKKLDELVSVLESSL